MFGIISAVSFQETVYSKNYSRKCLFKKLSKKKKKERNYHYTILHILCVCEYQTGFYEFP